MTDREIDRMLGRFLSSIPRAASTIGQNRIGIGLVLRYLEEIGRPVSAGEISRYMEVSTARVAVLLRTMSEKGLIERREDASDARKVCVTISEDGRARNRKAKEELAGYMAEIAARVGPDRLEAFLDVAEEIGEVVDGLVKKKQHA